MTEPILSIRVLGTPRPKGSLRHVGSGRLVEQLADSPDWRRAVVESAYAAVHCLGCDPHSSALRLGYPHLGPVTARIELWFPTPRSARRGALPQTRATGDIDKHARNVLDALQDAGVIRDDAQVVDLQVSKRYTADAPGARITVWPATLDAPPGGAALMPPPVGAETRMP